MRMIELVQGFIKTFLIAATLLHVSVAFSTVYKTTDENGNAVFSDTKSKDAERMYLPPLPVYKPVPLNPIRPANKALKATAMYSRLSIISPQPDAVVRNNAGNVEVIVALQPNLNASLQHRIQIYMDGAPLGEASTSTRFAFQNLDRGTHQIEAAVIDASGKKMIQGAQISFTLQRAAARGPTP